MVRNRQMTIAVLVLLLTASCGEFGSHASPIKHLVVLVMENRSFDHMLGWMKRLNPNIDGVDGSEFNLLNSKDPNSMKIFFGDQAEYVDPDPGHSFEAIREQIFGSDDSSQRSPPMNGFAQQAFWMDSSANLSRDVMNGFPPHLLSSYLALVSEFAVCDRWFASVPASTQPNRLFVHSATSSGATSNQKDRIVKGFPQRTIFDSLSDAGFKWGIYYQDIPATLLYRSLRKIKYAFNFKPYDLFFKEHAKLGKLPNYVVIEQRYMDTKLGPANDDHPSHDVFQGQLFVKEVYETLRASPQWNETLLVITYDEHGGFFDHVATPTSGVPSPDGIIGPEPFFFNFDRLGVRVPTILVSPWIQKGTVVHGANGSPFPTSEFEHSSIPATAKKIFGLPDFLTKRDEWAGTFEGLVAALTEPRADCPERLPNPVKLRKSEPKEDAKLSQFQGELWLLAGALEGQDTLTCHPNNMTVKEGKKYMADAVRRFFVAARDANRMGVDGDSIVLMRPSLTTPRNT